MDLSKHSRAIADTLSTHLENVGETKPFKAYLGDGTGTGNVQNQTGPYPRMVNFWRDSVEGRELGTAILDSNANIPWVNLSSMENTEVLIAYPARSKVPYVLRVTREGTQQFPGGGMSPQEQL